MRPPILFLILLTSMTFLGAQDPVYPGFLEKISGDPGWTAAESAYRIRQRTRWLSSLYLPDLSFSSQVSGTSSVPGPVPATLAEAPWTWPMSAEITFQVPLVDLGKGARLPVLSGEESLDEARWEEFRKESFAAFLTQLMEVLERKQLRESKARNTETYGNLAALAQRRQVLGAGSARESLLAEMAWRRSKADLSLADLDLQEAQGELGPQALRWFLSLPAQTPWFHPREWTRLLALWGWQDSLGEKDGAYRESPLWKKESDALDWSLAVLGAEEAPQVDFFSLVRVQNLPLQTFAQAGLKLRWQIFSDTGWGAGRVQARETLEARREDLVRRRTLAGEEAGRARDQYLLRRGVAMEREEISRTAEKFSATLQSALTAGTETLEVVLEGWQILASAQEEELSARWSVLKSAVQVLRTSGYLALPPGENP